jgi:D-glycero-D-manno-heptose 1,7-bisphosphate phosphatase
MVPIKLVILGRDGTINEERDDFVSSADDWVPLPGALDAIARLNHAGWHVVVATNQPGLGGGLFDMTVFNAVQLKMKEMLQKHGGRVEAVFFCPHTAEDHCTCRKPLPGLYQRIGERYGADLRQVPAVGNALDDLQAGIAAGCPAHLVLAGKTARLDAQAVARLLEQAPGAQMHADLPAFVEALLQHERAARGHTGEGDTGYGDLE